MTTADATPDLNTLSGRIASEIADAGDRAMRELYPDMPQFTYWSRLDDGTLTAVLHERHLHDGTLAAWIERFHLVESPIYGWDSTGHSRYAGTIDGIKIVLSGITDKAAWNAAKPHARVKAS